MNNRGTIILVHGAWQAAWCWRKTARLLAATGAKVLSPDLPGHGACRLPAKQVTLASYTESLLDLVRRQPAPVKLVGHSMAGMVISQVAETVPDRIDELVYVAGYIPRDGESLLGIAEHSQSRLLSPYLIIDRTAGEIRLQESSEVPALFYHLCSDEDKQQAALHLQPQPLQPFAATVSLGERFASVRKKALICRHDRVLLYADQERMSKVATDDIVTLEADHSPFFSATTALANAIMNSKEYSLNAKKFTR